MKWIEDSVPAAMCAMGFAGFIGGMAIATFIWNPQAFGLRVVAGHYIAENAIAPPPGFSYCTNFDNSWYERGSACHTNPSDRIDARPR